MTGRGRYLNTTKVYNYVRQTNSFYVMKQTKIL